MEKKLLDRFGVAAENKSAIVFMLLLITVLAFSPTLMNNFVRWDDHIYVTENELIKTISLNELDKFGTTVAGNFHPLTMLSLAIDYALFGMDPFYFHLTNLIFHALNTILVFFFIMKISRKNVFVSFFTALLFGIHPMHVESVAWVSERKDVLYSFFFLIGILGYYKYLKNRKLFWMFFVTGSFILSTLSKSAAVVFPVVLLLIDYYNNSHIKLRDFVDKIHLFAISITIGIIALNTQGKSGALELSNYSLIEKIQYSSSALFDYLRRFLFPEPLSNVHPFPTIVNNIVFFLPLIFLLLIGFYIIKYRRRYIWLFWGSSFFLITIALVLQLIQVGGSYMAERYTYIPYIGIGFIFYTVIYKLLSKFPAITYIVYIFITGQLLVYFNLTFEQTKTWKNSLSLWTNFIDKYPLHSTEAYTNIADYYLLNSDTLNALNAYKTGIEKNSNNFKVYTHRGKYYLDKGNYELAVADFNKALAINNTYIDALIGCGVVNFYLGDYNQAILFYDRAIELNPQNHEIYNLRGNVYLKMGLNDKALINFNQAINIKDDFQEAIANRVLVMSLSNDSLGIIHFTKLIEEDVENIDAYSNRGVLLYKRNEYDKALRDFDLALKINNKHTEALRGRSAIYYDLKQYSKAIEDITSYLEINPNNLDIIERRAICYLMLNNFRNAMKDYSLLIEKDPSKSKYFMGRALIYAKLGDAKNAMKDILIAKEKGEIVDENFIAAIQSQI